MKSSCPICLSNQLHSETAIRQYHPLIVWISAQANVTLSDNWTAAHVLEAEEQAEGLRENMKQIRRLDLQIWDAEEPIRRGYRQHIRDEFGIEFTDEAFAQHLEEQGQIDPRRVQ